MKHDKRLNGVTSGTRLATNKKKQMVLADRLETDPQLQGIRSLYFQRTGDAAKYEIETYLMGRTFRIVLATFGVDLEAVPKDIREHLKIDTDSKKDQSEAA